MIVVVFEFTVKEGRLERYLDLAAALRSEVEKLDGFISVERFESLAQTGRYVSVSFWRDAESVARWREHADHREAQMIGRSDVFADFRITVADATRRYTLADQKPKDAAVPPGL